MAHRLSQMTYVARLLHRGDASRFARTPDDRDLPRVRRTHRPPRKPRALARLVAMLASNHGTVKELVRTFANKSARLTSTRRRTTRPPDVRHRVAKLFDMLAA